MFGKSQPEPEQVRSEWNGPRFQVHVETFMAMENDKVVARRLNELGAEGWEPCGVLDKAVGLSKTKGDGAWSVLLKRQV